MKKIYWVIILLIVCAGAFQLYVTFILDENRPKELQSLMEKAKADKGFLKKVGKYETYKISYDYTLRDAQKDYPFEITLFCERGYIDFTGVAHYETNDNTWVITKNDTIIKPQQ